MNTKLNVSITQNYRLQVDATQYVLYELHTVDPTKAPGWNREQALADGKPTEKRTEWRSMERFYPLNANGLTAALLYVAMLESHDKLGARDDVSIGDLLAAYSVEVRCLNALIGGALSPAILREIGAPVAAE